MGRSLCCSGVYSLVRCEHKPPHLPLPARTQKGVQSVRRRGRTVLGARNRNASRRWAKRDGSPREQTARPRLSLALSGHPLAPWSHSTGQAQILLADGTSPVPGAAAASDTKDRAGWNARRKSQGRWLTLPWGEQESLSHFHQVSPGFRRNSSRKQLHNLVSYPHSSCVDFLPRRFPWVMSCQWADQRVPVLQMTEARGLNAGTVQGGCPGDEKRIRTQKSLVYLAHTRVCGRACGGRGNRKSISFCPF